jgi:anti-sigma regulatory factor (Ser/Thr protein kinase)
MGQMPSWSHSVELRAVPASASQAREFVCLHLLSNGLPHLQDDLRLVVSELVTNAITHAQTPFTVVLERAGPSVTLTVQDLSPLVPVMGAADTMDGGGRGLVIIDVVSSEWGVTSRPGGPKSVWAAFAVEDGVTATS